LAVVVPGDGAKDHLESGIDLRGRPALRDCIGTRWGSRCQRRGKKTGSRGAEQSARRSWWRWSRSRRCEWWSGRYSRHGQRHRGGDGGKTEGVHESGGKGHCLRDLGARASVAGSIIVAGALG
jgi:hypothetical protein